MKIFADENIARAIVNWLRESDHDVLYAPDTRPGERDSAWPRQSDLDHRIVMTADKDFGELIFRDRLSGQGILLLRIENLTIRERIERLDEVWPLIEEKLRGNFTVISEGKIRIRGRRQV